MPVTRRQARNIRRETRFSYSLDFLLVKSSIRMEDFWGWRRSKDDVRRKTQISNFKTLCLRNLSQNLAPDPIPSQFVFTINAAPRRQNKDAKRNEGKEEETSSLRVSVQHSSHR